MEVGSYESVTVYLELGHVLFFGPCVAVYVIKGYVSLLIVNVVVGDIISETGVEIIIRCWTKGVEMPDDGTHGYEYGSGRVVV